MAQYEIKYLDGHVEHLISESVNIDDESKVFVFHTGSIASPPDALIPTSNVRSVVRQAEAVDA